MTKLANLADIPVGRGLRVDVDGKCIALFRLGEDVHAICAVCPHRGGPLEDGALDEGMVYCPWHGWEFDIRTGVSPTFGDKVECYPVEIRDGEVFLKQEATS